MAKIQRWSITLDGVMHHLTYTRPFLSRHVILQIDDEQYKLPRGAREEPFRLGEEQAILRICRNGRAQILTRMGEAEEA